MLRSVLVFIVVVFLLAHNLPYLVRDQVVIWLLNNGAERAQLTAIDVDWWQGQVTVRGLQAKAEGKPALAIEQARVDLDYSTLSDKRILLTDIILHGVDLGIRQQDAHLWVGPVDLNALPKGDETAAEDDSTPSEWSFGLARLQLDDIDWQAEVGGQKHHLIVNSAQLADLYLWDQQQAVAISLDGQLNGAPVVIASSSKPLPEDKSSQLSIKLEGFPLQSVTHVFMPELRAVIDLDLTIDAHSNLATQATTVAPQGQIRVRDFNWQQDDLRISHRDLNWQGSAKVALNGPTLNTISSQNKLAVAGLQLEQAGSKVNLTKLDLNTALSMQGLTTLALQKLQLDLSGLQLQQGSQSLNLAQAAVSGDIKTAELKNLDIPQLAVQLSDLQLAQGKQKVRLGQGNLSATVQSADMQRWQVNAPKLSLSKLAVLADQESLITLDDLSASSLTVDHTDYIGLDALTLNALVVQGEGGVLTQWQKLQAQQVKLDQLQTLTIDRVDLQDSRSRVLLSPKRNLPDLDWLLARLQPAGDSAGDSKAENAAAGTPFRVNIKQLTLTGENRIQIVDRGVKPAFETRLDISKLRLAPLDTAGKGVTQYELQAKSKFSQINAKGAIELFSGNYGGNWDASIKGLELPDVSPYSLEYTGYYLQSGQLTLNTEGTIKSRKLQGSTDIRLNKLEVEARHSERSGEFDQKVSMPLSTAIMVLKDNDDNIDLQIPVDGSLDDPQFGYQTVINKLAGKGLKSAAVGYLTKALQPFGALISIGQMVMEAQDKGSFISLQPVQFTPADAALSKESQAYMDKLAQMLNERKAMRINICGMAVAADQPLLWQQLQEENKKREKKLTDEALQEELNQRLQLLAQQRSDAVKEQLSGKGIDIERLFSCYPKVDLKSQLQPQVALGI